MFCEGLLLARAECPMPAHCNVKRQLAFTHQWAPCPKMDTGGLFQGEKKSRGRSIWEHLYVESERHIKSDLLCSFILSSSSFCNLNQTDFQYTTFLFYFNPKWLNIWKIWMFCNISREKTQMKWIKFTKRKTKQHVHRIHLHSHSIMWPIKWICCLFE